MGFLKSMLPLVIIIKSIDCTFGVQNHNKYTFFVITNKTEEQKCIRLYKKYNET